MRLTALPPRKRCTGTERSPGGLLTARKCVSSCTTCRGSLSDTSLMLAGARSNSRTTLSAASSSRNRHSTVCHVWQRGYYALLVAGAVWQLSAAWCSYGKGTLLCELLLTAARTLSSAAAAPA